MRLILELVPECATATHAAWCLGQAEVARVVLVVVLVAFVVASECRKVA